MKNIAYYNGYFGTPDEIRIPIDDRALYFGDGIYDVATVISGVPFALDDHIDRFFSSCSIIKIELPFSKSEFKETLLDIVSKLDSDIAEAVLYFQASRGSAPRAHVFPENAKPNILITLKESKFKTPGQQISAISCEDRRYYFCNVKTINLIPNVLAAQYAKENGCYEVVFHRGSRVTEGCHSNISILKNGAFQTAPLDELVLPGVTRKHYIALCKKLGITAIEKPFTLDELKDADEIIVSSSTAICSRVICLDGKEVGGKDPSTLEKLKNAYIEKIESEIAK